ncbi:MAG: patatin-like phospholipase family protein [Bacteroidota bacterium]
MKEFLEHPEIKKILPEVDKLKREKKRFSDIEDAKGYQYVDLVQEGGGILGIALVGYTYVLEKTGIRFYSLAGTSAGAINTMMIAALGKTEEAKSEKILEILSNKNLFELVDGEKIMRTLIRKFIRQESGLAWTIIWNIRKFYRILTSRMGMNPGDNFVQWINNELNKAGIKTMADIERLRSKTPEGIKHVGDQDISDMHPKIAIIAADITTHSKIEFPKMSELYFDTPASVKPSLLVRTSMSIPLFFEPVSFDRIPNVGVKNDPKWIEYCKYYGPVPGKAVFVDGGLLSNFPINVFHRKRGTIPRKPTFGARLSTYRKNFTEINSMKSMMGSMINSMRQIYDYDFLRNNPDYSQLICHIDADKDFNWLDFEIERKDQINMFLHGARQALDFLQSFDWEKYKETRRKLAMT